LEEPHSRQSEWHEPGLGAVCEHPISLWAAIAYIQEAGFLRLNVRTPVAMTKMTATAVTP